MKFIKLLLLLCISCINYLFISWKLEGCDSASNSIACKFNCILSWNLYFWISINIFVLLSFILAIGIITDDSVIMTDAIYRRIENGETPLVAAYKGSKQITFAIIATTLILIAVFLP